jgi:hypothetical protein
MAVGGSNELDAKLNLRVDDERRVVVIGTPDGLDGMTDAEILALLRRASELREQYRAAGYAVTRWGAEHPKWRPQP